jgi:UDP-N-acetylglucosamine--N-acetylmuramyl-(pentapeptide) pyrophosphoryl-undecaprenol N-acetylglucosamine transferase
MSTILFVGGGTLGHITPAVAIARALQDRNPDISVHFVCSPRGEAEFLQKESLPFTIIDAPRLSWNFPWKFFLAHRKALRLLRSLKPQLIFSKGGYVSVPMCFAAKKLGIPIILHESDAVMGRANRLIAKMATKVCLGFPKNSYTQESSKRTNEQTSKLFTGNPLRSEITKGSREEGLRITGFSGKRPILLIMGGSQGAQTFNEWTHHNLTNLTNICDVIHLTGHGKQIHEKTSTPKNYWATEFAHAELPHIYACTDLAVSRSGAGSIAELLGNGIPGIFIPLTGVAHDHQMHNAESLYKRGLCWLVTQIDMDRELLNVVSQLLLNSKARDEIRSKIRAERQGDSTGQIVKLISDILVTRRAP